MKKITVIDAPCGAGKTSWSIQMINSMPEENFVFCTPYLDEISRIQESCRMANGQLRFREPLVFNGPKIDDFNNLLSNCSDIAVTHCTFLNATEETLDYIREGNYYLIVDEVLDVLIDFNHAQSVENDVRQSVNKADVTALISQNLISVGRNYKVTWTGGDYEPEYKYYEVARYAKMGRLYCVRNQLMMLVFPPEVFQCFKKVYVLTYMFDGSVLKHYFDYFGIDCEMASIEPDDNLYRVVPYSSELDMQFRRKCRDLINICKDERLNGGLKRNALSKRWYDNSKNDDRLQKLRNNIGHYFNRVLPEASASNGDIMWTCPKEYEDKLKGKGYTRIKGLTREEMRLPMEQRQKLENEARCFVPCNARATNKYRARWALAYCYNMYYNPYIRGFFADREEGSIELNEDAYALSCLIQWIFRSRIRDGKPIEIYIPSVRMRELLMNWLNVDSGHMAA